MTPMLLQNKEQSSQSLLALLPDQQATPRMALRVLSRQPPRAASSPTPLPTPHSPATSGLHRSAAFCSGPSKGNADLWAWHRSPSEPLVLSYPFA